MNKADKAVKLFNEGYACAQSIVLAFAEDVGLDETTAKKISSTFGGGMGRLRKTCGVLTGAFMILGMKFGNEKPDDMKTKLNSYNKVQRITASFKEIHETTNCGKLINKYATEQQIKDRDHHKLICEKLVRDAANLLDEMLCNNTIKE